MTSPHSLSVAEAATGIRTRTLSPVELVVDCLKRIEALDPKLNAFIRVDPEMAIADARAAEAEIMRDGPRGPLHGIPVGLKDIFDVKGIPTTCHSKLRLDYLAPEDAAVVVRLRDGGAIPLGKLSTHEFAFGGPCFDLPFPPARNPWDRSRHPGGSSSGSAVAVAARMLPAALGSDTGGSIRNPAGTCGVVGMKPTYDLVPREGVFPLSPSLDHVGPITRTVADNAILLNCIAGPATDDYSGDLSLGLKGLRIGFVRHFHEADVPATAEVAAALEEAARTFRQEGAEVRDTVLVPLAEFNAISRVLLLSEAAAIHERPLRERPEDFAAWTRQRLLPGLFFSAVDYIQAQRRRAELIASIDAAFADCDVLLVANSMDVPCHIDDQESLERLQPLHARSAFNVTGHPALAMMCGLSGEGLPISFQLAAPAFAERLLYRAAAGYERATRWHRLAPAD